MSDNFRSMCYPAYGVFCMAIALGGDKYELDAWWDDAMEHYETFLDSEFFDVYKSELECINEYVKSLRPDGV
jgi:hypothetical protein